VGIVAEDIERVRSSTSIVELVSQRVALRRVGTRWVGLCPFHGEKTASFSVNDELGVYYCFGCQAHGDVISFVRETQQLDFVSAVEALAAGAGIALRYDGDEHAAPARRRNNELTGALERAVAWYHERLLSAPDAAGARQYLRRRGYDSETVKHFSLGWAPEGWDTLVRQAGIDHELLVVAGLAYRKQAGRLNDSFRARVLFPIFDAAGRPVGLGGRVLPGAGTSPKYKNTQATPLYDKSKVLYGLNWAKKTIVERGQVVVCEGYTDVIGLHNAGVTEAVATCGTALAEGHVRLLVGFSRRILLAYDADSAGQGAAERFYDWERRLDVDIAVVALPPGTDPADLAKSAPETLRQAVDEAKPYLGFRLERLFASSDLRNPEGRARAAEAAVALVAEHPDPVVRDQYLMSVSDRCKISPERLRAMVSAARERGPGRRAGTGREAGGRSRGPGQGAEAGRETGAAPLQAPAPARGAHRPPVPLPELEALRVAVHHPEKVVGRMDIALFSSDLARAAFDDLASAMTLHAAIEGAAPQVADLLSQVAAVDCRDDPDDVLRVLVDHAAARALDDLQRHARVSAPVGAGTAGGGTVEGGAELRVLKLALDAMRSIEPGPGREERLAHAEQHLLALLLGSPSVSPGPSG
jgi:DNA primase